MVHAPERIGNGSGHARVRIVAGLTVAAFGLLCGGGATQETPRGQGPGVEEIDVLGVVVDAESGTGLIGAWVGITGTDWGSITNAEGRFRIPDMFTGALSLTIEQLGYETLQWSGDVSTAGDALRIEMTPRPVLLEGLQIVTDRFRSRRRAVASTTFAYEPAQLSSASERSALEFISYRTPGVTRCDVTSATCLRVRGRAVEPVVYIDEAPLLGGLDYLDAYAPWEFHLIEVYAGGRHIRAYTHAFMQRAAETRLLPLPLFF